jgi:hypothetical protein
VVDQGRRNANPFYQEFFSLLELLPLLDRPGYRRSKSQPRKQLQVRLESERASELIQRYQAGSTVNELAEEFKVHR